MTLLEVIGISGLIIVLILFIVAYIKSCKLLKTSENISNRIKIKHNNRNGTSSKHN